MYVRHPTLWSWPGALALGISRAFANGHFVGPATPHNRATGGKDGRAGMEGLFPSPDLLTQRVHFDAIAIEMLPEVLAGVKLSVPRISIGLLL